jgi:glycosyltransferase involved in cell wall biosynthesis
VALPIFHLVTGLKELHDVSYLYLDGGAQGFAGEDVLAVNAAFVDLEVIPVRRKSRLSRTVNELFQTEPYFHGYDMKDVQVPPKARLADVYCFSPFTALAFASSSGLNRRALRLAWINDSTTAMMRSRLNYVRMKGIPVKKRLHLLSQWFRSLYMGRLESAALAEFDLIFVQTETEKRWIDRISKGSLTKQTRVVTNGVNQTLFKRPIESGKPSFLFFGDMSGIYDDLVIWLLKNVWVILRESVPNSNFHLIGKNASDNVLKLVHDDPLVNYQSYVENIEDVFLDKGIMLAPVFKDFGVINKVLESMAAGVPVVGDRTAFNGIAGFQNATHGIIADSPADMAAAAKRLVSDANLYEEIAAQARSLMQDNFSWGSRIAAFDHGIRDVLRDQSK